MTSRSGALKELPSCNKEWTGRRKSLAKQDPAPPLHMHTRKKEGEQWRSAEKPTVDGWGPKDELDLEDTLVAGADPPSAKRKRNSASPSLGPVSLAVTRYLRVGPQLELSDEHIRALDLVVRDKKNVFITGGAGSGKSAVVWRLKELLPPSTTYFTAPTGVAAFNIGGTTVHSFAGVGTGEMSSQELYYYVKENHMAHWRWSTAKVVIIDEVSMLSAAFFHALNFLGRMIRRNKKPFGGIQLVCVGDFFQLPPVSTSRDREDKYKPSTAHGAKAQYCFQSKDWDECIDEVVVFSESLRHAEDSAFAAMLQEIRLGECSKETTAALDRVQLAPVMILGDSIEPTQIYCLNREVNAVNERRLDALPGRGKQYVGVDKGVLPELSTLQRACPAPLHLRLKIGAQVMLLKNLDVVGGLVNGSRGVVTAWDETRRGYPRVRFVSGLERTIEPEKFSLEVGGVVRASRKQVPLQLAWAVTVHKSQGSTLDCARVSLSKAFEYGQVYVALSRVRGLRGLRLAGFAPSAIKAHPAVLAYYAGLESAASPRSPENAASRPPLIDLTSESS